MEKTYGIFHSRDCDGYASGAIIKHKYPKATLIGYDYGQPFPWDRIEKGVPVIMADVSLPMVDMLELAKHSGMQFTWIDHHRSAINDYERLIEGGESFCTAVLQDGIAACEITWKYLFPDKPTPESIKLLGIYDTWRRSEPGYDWENEVLPFQFGFRTICKSPQTFPAWAFEENPTDEIKKVIETGKIILAYQAGVNESQCKKAFEFEFEGLRAICLNNGGFNSEVFKSVYDESKHDIMMPFQYDGRSKKWQFSLYSTKKDIDCSVIAKKYGGGGHFSASGFSIFKLEDIFTFINEENAGFNKVNYITASELGNIADNWIKSEPHNNGYAVNWEIIPIKDSAFPEIEKYFLDRGLKIGDKVIIHDKW